MNTDHHSETHEPLRVPALLHAQSRFNPSLPGAPVEHDLIVTQDPPVPSRLRPPADHGPLICIVLPGARGAVDKRVYLTPVQAQAVGARLTELATVTNTGLGDGEGPAVHEALPTGIDVYSPDDGMVWVDTGGVRSVSPAEARAIARTLISVADYADSTTDTGSGDHGGK